MKQKNQQKMQEDLEKLNNAIDYAMANNKTSLTLNLLGEQSQLIEKIKKLTHGRMYAF